MSIQELLLPYAGDDFVVYGEPRLLREIESLKSKFGLSESDSKRVDDKLKEICSNPHITDKNIQKELSGYDKGWYECRIFHMVDGGKDLRLVFTRKKHVDKEGTYYGVNLVGLYNHKEIKKGLPKRSTIFEELDESDIKFFDYILNK